MTHLTAHPKWHLDQFSHFCTAHCRVSLHFTMAGPPLPLKIVPSHGGSAPSLIHGSLVPTRVLHPNDISIGSPVFLGLMIVTDRPWYRQAAAPFAHCTICPFLWCQYCHIFTLWLTCIMTVPCFIMSCLSLRYGWRGSATGRALDLRSVGCGFKSYSRQRCVTTLGKLFTPTCLSQ